MTEIAQNAGPSPDRSKITDPAQFGVVIGMLILAGLVIFDTMNLRAATVGSDPVGPKAVPYLLAAALIVIATCYAVDIFRGGRGIPEAGEDVDLHAPVDWRTVLLLIGAYITNMVLIEPMGWVISSTAMFWLAAFALGNRRHLLALMIAVVLALVSFYAFAVGLGVNLPAGILKGIL